MIYSIAILIAALLTQNLANAEATKTSPSLKETHSLNCRWAPIPVGSAETPEEADKVRDAFLDGIGNGNSITYMDDVTSQFESTWSLENFLFGIEGPILSEPIYPLITAKDHTLSVAIGHREGANVIGVVLTQNVSEGRPAYVKTPEFNSSNGLATDKLDGIIYGSDWIDGVLMGDTYGYHINCELFKRKQ